MIGFVAVDAIFDGEKLEIVCDVDLMPDDTALAALADLSVILLFKNFSVILLVDLLNLQNAVCVLTVWRWIGHWMRSS